MLNRFKNALYGSGNVIDERGPVDSRDDYKEAVLDRRVRTVIKRSTSFQEDLTRRQGADPQYNHIRHRTIHDVAMRFNFATQSRSGEDLRYQSQTVKVPKFRYSRPEFLQLKTDDEILVSADHQIRPIILPRDNSRLPWKSGYAECINAGKSLKNEDQASIYQDVLIKRSSTISFQENDSFAIESQLPWYYFGIFDGHAGTAVAVAAAMQLHNIIGEKLNQIADLLIALEFDLIEDDSSTTNGFNHDEKKHLNSSCTDINQNNEQYSDCETELERLDDKNCPRLDSQKVKLNSHEEVNSNEHLFHKELETIEEIIDNLDSSEQNHDNNLSKESKENGNQVELKDKDKVIQDHEESKHSELETKCITTDEKNTESKQDKLTNNDNKNDELELKEGLKEKEILNNSHNRSTNNDTFHDNSKIRIKTKTQDYSDLSNNNNRDGENLPNMIDIFKNKLSVDKLIVGALESAFWEMDEQIARDKDDYKMPGGCTANVALFILGKLYVCNAGDSRAIVYKNNQVIPMSFDFTPTSEKERILRLGLQRPEFLGTDFTHLEFLRRPTRKDLGKQMLYKNAYMTGWSMKKITTDDLKFPLVWGEGKRSRVLATIGVTRGFGDHELRAQYGSVLIKPFLTPEPEVRILPLEGDNNLTAEDVLIIGSDGLWDVTTNEEAAEIVKSSFDLFPDNEESRSRYRYITAAQDLVIHSRGQTTNWNNVWRTENNEKMASLDDIAVFVIPLKQYRDDYIQWKQQRSESVSLRRNNNKMSDVVSSNLETKR